MTNELVGILALIYAEQARIEAIKAEIQEDLLFDRPSRSTSSDLWLVTSRLEELYSRAMNAI